MGNERSTYQIAMQNSAKDIRALIDDLVRQFAEHKKASVEHDRSCETIRATIAVLKEREEFFSREAN